MEHIQEDWLPPAEEINLSELDALVTESSALWDDYDAKKKIASEAHTKAEDIDKKILAILNKANKSKYFVDGVGTIAITRTEQVKVPSNVVQKKTFFNYLSELGEDVFLSLATVNSQSLNAWYRQQLENARTQGTLLGFSVPGVEEPTTRETLRFTKDRKGKS